MEIRSNSLLSTDILVSLFHNCKRQLMKHPIFLGIVPDLGLFHMFPLQVSWVVKKNKN